MNTSSSSFSHVLISAERHDGARCWTVVRSPVCARSRMQKRCTRSLRLPAIAILTKSYQADCAQEAWTESASHSNIDNDLNCRTQRWSRPKHCHCSIIATTCIESHTFAPQLWKRRPNHDFMLTCSRYAYMYVREECIGSPRSTYFHSLVRPSALGRSRGKTTSA